MKKIIISLAIIGVVAAISLGVTGAWWTDSATSTNTSFHSGTMNLQLANSGSDGQPAGGWKNDEVTQTWDYNDMAPGGKVVGGNLWLQNNGSIPADWLKFTTKTTSDKDALDKVMRITKLDYAGKSLLTGSAGADLSDYTAPAVESCDVIVDNNDGKSTTPNTIQGGINAAATGNTVCVESGTYNGNVNVDDDITLVALNSPISGSPAIVKKTIVVSATGATVKGLRVEGLTVAGAEPAIKVSASDVTIDSNVVYNMTGDGSGTIKGIHVYASTAEISNIALTNNWIEKIYDTGKGSDGIMVQGHLNGVTITHNTIKNIRSNNNDHDWDYAIGIEDTPTSGHQGSPLNVVVTDNHIEDIVSVIEPGRGFSVDMDDVDNYAYATQVTFKGNNLVNIANDLTNKDQRSGGILNATGNWFGDNGIAVNVNGEEKGEIGAIDTTNYAGGPFIGYINGKDYNSNDFADLNDFYGITSPSYDNDPIVVENPELGSQQKLELYVQLDGPTSNNDQQGGTVGLDVTATMGQGPAN